MFRIAMVSMIVTMGLVGCGEDVAQKPIHKEQVAVAVTPSMGKNEVNTQDVKKDDVQAVAIHAQTTEASQAVAESLAKTQKMPTSEHVKPLKVVEKKVKTEAVKEKAPVAVVEVEKVVVADAQVKPAEAAVDSVVPSDKPKQVLALGDAAKGKVLAKRCASCHDFGMKDKVGPHLQGVFNSAAGQSGFKRHSAAFKTANWTWDEAHLLKWLCDSKSAIKEFTGNASAKTKMPKQNMCGVKGRDIVAYLKSI